MSMIALLDRTQLDNGLNILLAPNRHAPVVAVQAWVGVGAAVERAREAGLAHVLEHMLFKGTRRRGVGEIAKAVEGAGGEINAWTSFNETVFHVVLASRYFDTALDVLADALQNPSFDPLEIEREREVILEEIKHSRDDPMRRVAQNLFATAYTRHPYRRPVIGSADVVRSVTRRQLVDFLATWYVPNNMTLVVAGDFDPRRARRKIAARFGKMRSRPLKRRTRREPRQQATRISIQTQDVSEAHLALGFHIPSLKNPDTAALDLAAIVLGQGESSRLSAAVLRDRELVTSIYSYVHTLRDRGLFVVSALLRPENLKPAAAAIAAEVYRLADDEIGYAELDKARHAVEADTVYQVETAQGVARKLGFYESVAGDAEFESAYLDRVRRSSAGQIRAAASRHLRLDNTTVAVLLPDRGRYRTENGRAAVARRIDEQLQRGVRAAARGVSRRAKLRRASDRALVREVLPNGLRVLIKPDDSVPIVAIRAVWLGGVRLETARDNGITNLLASTITRGCRGHSSNQISKMVDEMAGTLAGSSGRNSFGLRAEWLAKNWERGFDLMADCIRSPEFEPSEFAREKRRIFDELLVRQDDPGFLSLRLFSETLFRRHPYRLDPMGTPQSVEALSRDRVRGHYQRHCPVGGMTLAFTGDVDPDRILERVGDRFGDLPRTAAPRHRVPGEKFSRRSARSRRVRRWLDRQQAHLVIGFPGTTLDDPDRYVLEVLTTVLGGQGGRLFVELRDRQALAYRVGALSMEGIDPGYLAAYLACSPEKLEAAQRGVRSELDRVVERGVSKSEVDRAVAYLLGIHEISLQRRAVLASALAFHEAYGLGHDEYQRYAARIKAVTADQVQRVAATYVRWDRAVTASVEPPRPKATGRKR